MNVNDGRSLTGTLDVMAQTNLRTSDGYFPSRNNLHDYPTEKSKVTMRTH